MRVALITHLRGDLVFRGRLGQQPRFPRRACERLLDIHVLATLHGGERDGGVHVIGDHDRHRVDALLLVEQLAIVLVFRRLLPAFETLGAAGPVHVGQRDDVLRVERPEHAHGTAAGADAGDIHLLVGGLIAECLQ